MTSALEDCSRVLEGARATIVHEFARRLADGTPAGELTGEFPAVAANASDADVVHACELWERVASAVRLVDDLEGLDAYSVAQAGNQKRSTLTKIRPVEVFNLEQDVEGASAAYSEASAEWSRVDGMVQKWSACEPESSEFDLRWREEMDRLEARVRPLVTARDEAAERLSAARELLASARRDWLAVTAEGLARGFVLTDAKVGSLRDKPNRG